MPSIGASSTKLRQKHTERMLSQYLDDLPVLPNVTQVLLQAQERGGRLADRVEALARLDPTLALRISYLGRQRSPANQAAALGVASEMARVGSVQVVRGLMDLTNRPIFHPERAHERELWLHSIQVALTARYFANTSPSLKIGGEEAYFCGLLHDLGRFIILVAAPDSFTRLENCDWNTGDDLVTAERSILGYDHAQLGAMACKAWNLSPVLAAVIRFHHSDPERYVVDPRALKLTRVVMLADAVSFLMVKHPDMIAADAPSRELLLEEQNVGPIIAKLGISMASVVRALGDLHHASIAHVDELFGESKLLRPA